MKDTELPDTEQLGRDAHSRTSLSHLRIAYALMLVLSLASMWKMGSRRELLVGTEITASIPPIERNKSLFYVTTHLSPSHYEFFQKCWPSLLAKSQLYKESDFLIFATGSNASNIDWSVLNATFANATYAVQVMDNPGYQEGAMLALTEAFSKHWFDGYEWDTCQSRRADPERYVFAEEYARLEHQGDFCGLFGNALCNRHKLHE